MDNFKKSFAADSLQMQQRMISYAILNCSSPGTAERPIGVRMTGPVSIRSLHGDAAADPLSLVTSSLAARYQLCGRPVANES
jgi:hypothetical protein